MHAMEISRTGLNVEWRRLEVIAQNLANANSSAPPGTRAYQSLQLVSGPAFAEHLAGHQRSQLNGVQVYRLEPSRVAPRIVHEPASPNADANGNVAYPGVDYSGEMTSMIATSRAYEANVVAMNAARQMYEKALDLGKSA